MWGKCSYLCCVCSGWLGRRAKALFLVSIWWLKRLQLSALVYCFFLSFSSPSSHSSPRRRSRTESVHAGMERCSPSMGRSAMMETRSSQMPVSVRWPLQAEAKNLHRCSGEASLREIVQLLSIKKTTINMFRCEMHWIIKSDFLAIKA